MQFRFRCYRTPLTEAAKWAGVTRPTIFKALKSGKLSGQKDDAGEWRIDPAELGAHDHFLLETDEGRRLALNDSRRFGSLDLLRSDTVAAWPPFAAIGFPGQARFSRRTLS